MLFTSYGFIAFIFALFAVYYLVLPKCDSHNGTKHIIFKEKVAIYGILRYFACVSSPAIFISIFALISSVEYPLLKR